MFASLPMYDRAETAAANDFFWQAIRAHLGFGPKALTRDEAVCHDWLSPDMLLSQTCGLPYRARLHGRVSLIGTPDYRLPGCPPGYYRSVFVCRVSDRRRGLNDFAVARFAVNSTDSQSGWAAALNHGYVPAETVVTGAHRASAKAVLADQADIACLDAHSWRLMQRHDAFASELREIAHTAPTPGLPLISALPDPKPLREAIRAALAEGYGKTLDISRLVVIPKDVYLAVPTPHLAA